MRRSWLAVIVLAASACGVDGDQPNATQSSPSAEARFTKEDFASYLDALKAHDYDGFTSYYTSDVKLTMGSDVLDRDGIINMERSLAAVWDWKMDVNQIVLDDAGAAIRATMVGPFLIDVPEFFGAAPKAGERWRLDFSMFYVLRDGKIAEVRAGPAVFTQQP